MKSLPKTLALGLRVVVTVSNLGNYRYRGSSDAFVAKLSGDGQTVYYSTYLGGTYPGGGHDDEGRGIAVDGAGNAYVTGYTWSKDFPTANAKYPNYSGREDAFVSKLSGDGQTVYYSTYLGGSNGDEGWGIAVDGAGNAYVTGSTASGNFPTANAPYPNLSGRSDAFVAKLSGDGQTVHYSTYLGGSSGDGGGGIAVDGAGNAYVTGSTDSPDFPTANAKYPNYSGGAYTGDAFIVKLSGGTIKTQPIADKTQPIAECLFAWAERNYPAAFAPPGSPTTVGPGYTYRYYLASNSSLAVSWIDNHLYYADPYGESHDEGSLPYWLLLAGCPPPTECLFNWAERSYPALFAPAGTPTAVWFAYTYRYYSATNTILSVSSLDNHVYYTGAGGELRDEGLVFNWLFLVGCQ